MSSTLRPHVGIGVFVIRQKRVLFGKRLAKHGEATWSLPGGHLEFGESWEECAIREVAEETGLSIDHPRFVGVTNDLFPSTSKHYVTLFLKVAIKNGDPKVLEPHCKVEWSWFDFNDLPQPLFLPVQNFLKTHSVTDLFN